jgi:hypothetical protein
VWFGSDSYDDYKGSKDGTPDELFEKLGFKSVEYVCKSQDLAKVWEFV